MDWIERSLQAAKLKKQREKLHYLITDWYGELREGGYDHDEARAVIIGNTATQNAYMVPLVSLWIEREGGEK